MANFWVGWKGYDEPCPISKLGFTSAVSQPVNAAVKSYDKESTHTTRNLTVQGLRALHCATSCPGVSCGSTSFWLLTWATLPWVLGFGAWAWNISQCVWRLTLCDSSAWNQLTTGKSINYIHVHQNLKMWEERQVNNSNLNYEEHISMWIDGISFRSFAGSV